MNRYFVITKNGILAFSTAFLLMFVAVSLSHAEDTASVAKKYDITFPVTELGNCANLDECKSFCSNLANQQTCVDFAKKHRFYKDDEAKTKQAEILTLAKTELGCSTESECRTFCGEQQNWIKCGEFAKRHGLGGGNTANGQDGSKKQEMLTKAKQFLGCNSYEECKTFCQNPDNHQKCEEFARVVGLQSLPPQVATKSGCTSAMCRAYCDRYPDQCRQFSAGGKEHSVPDRSACQNLKEKMGSASGETIRAYYQKYCLSNSKFYISSYSGSTIVKDSEYCKNNPAECPAAYPGKPNPYMEERCRSYPGCSWSGTACQCTSSSVKGITTFRSILQPLLDWFK